jgi:HSP20 family protein
MAWFWQIRAQRGFAALVPHGQPLDRSSDVLTFARAKKTQQGGRIMKLVKWDPFREMTTLQDRINRLFNDAFPTTADRETDLSLSDWKPAVDIYETADHLTVKVELPGVQKEDVSVEIKDNVLTIKGERKVETEVEDRNYYRRERAYGSFRRTFNLQYPVNPEKIKAKFRDGVLQVEVPKPEEEKPKQVTVNVE